ncbi:MAG: Dipeptidyl peptidase IV [Candidatus Saccharicenans subterraneus]|uniref:Dipeptidyl peptidase IV n=1 Tax=Candidatus Saccharicenans subterraneus TaxID=2508984 RepID=A0A3E2BJG2_9BACT|nr:MAG: Dipeptidyl peptidase IV [Candidatus Saccharicenans subterraneum]
MAIKFNRSSINQRFVLALLFLLLVGQAGLNSAATPEKANYELAARWTPARVARLVFDLSVEPRWLKSGDRFWYSFETPQGKSWYLVDPAARSRRPLFDNARMAAELTRILLTPYDAQHLPIKTIKFVKNETAIQFEVEVPLDNEVSVDGQVMKVSELEKRFLDREKEKEKEQDTEMDKTRTEKEKPKEPEKKTRVLGFEYDLKTSRLSLIKDYEARPKRPRWASLSPDKKWVVFARGHNLFLMDAENYARALKKPDDKTIQEIQLTTDGEEAYSFSRRLRDDEIKELQKDEKDRKDFRRPAIMIFWSQDSKKFACIRQDERKVGELWVINSLASPRPTLESYRYGMPGEENQPQPEILVFDLATRDRLKVKAEKFKDPTFNIFTAPRPAAVEDPDEPPPATWVSKTSDRLYFGRQTRDLHGYEVCLADTRSGEVRTIISERLNTYVEYQPLRLVNGGRQLIWWSERDGWGHYYLYDSDGRLLNQITSGEFNCQEVVRVDEKGRLLYFTACGREKGEDPYYEHLYRVGLDGSGLKLLTPGNFNHSVSMPDSARFFVVNYSRVDTAPRSDLYDSAGNRLLELETVDTGQLLAAGFKFPETFTVKAADGITDLYGVMYKPFDFDPEKKYPIIAYVYPGPQTESVSKSFSPRNQNVALAQLGFVVIEVGNRGGSPMRSKWYHNYGYGNLRDYGLADKKYAIEQLAARHPFIDINRVGIYGHSGGGFMTAAALLVYPDFFKVGVSSSGNHENNIYNRWWSEKHHGVKEVVDKDGQVKFEYSIDKNSELAGNLKGHLLLVTGDIDDNVHPANTFRLAAALIKAGKRFDFFLFPGQRHGYGDMNDYWFWIRADYFARHLLGDYSQTVDLVELQREKEKSGEKKAAK